MKNIQKQIINEALEAMIAEEFYDDWLDNYDEHEEENAYSYFDDSVLHEIFDEW